VADNAAERVAFLVVHAGLSLTEVKGMTLREYTAVVDALRAKGTE
jgi:hypothetical protein